MATWATNKTDIKQLLTDIVPSNDLFVAAVAAYVKAAISREVDKDLELARAYERTFKDLKERLVGYDSSLLPGSTLDTEVDKLLTVDATRQGIANFVDFQVKLGHAEIESMAGFIDKTIRQGVLDLQTYIPNYRYASETTIAVGATTAVGQVSRGTIPANSRILQAFYVKKVPALAELTAYVAGDWVLSNGHVYEVVSGGTIGGGQLGGGLTDTTGNVVSLGGLSFIYLFEEYALHVQMTVQNWDRRLLNAATLADCATRDLPPTIMLDEEGVQFFAWPKLDADHEYRLSWQSLKADYADGDATPLDESAIRAVADFVKSKLMAELDQPRKAQDAWNSYAEQRAKLYAHQHERRLIKY